MRRAIASILCLTVLTGACAGEDTEAASLTAPNDPLPTTTSSTASVPPSTTVATSLSTTTSAPPTTSAVPTTTTEPPQIVPGPVAGTSWAVVGITDGDVLNVRRGPGTTHSVVATLDPQAEDVIVAGDAALVDRSIWWTLETPPGAWVNAWYLAGVGLTEDRTAELVEQHGSIPAATSMDELTTTVLAIFDSDSTTVTVSSSEDTVGGEQVIDAFYEEGDDSMRGFRLHVFGQRDSDSGPFSLYAVEQTQLCWRGVDPQGLCI